MADNKPKLYTATSPKGIAKFPRLNTPDTKFQANGVFSTKLEMSGDDAAPLMEAIEKEAEAALTAARAELEKKLSEAKPKDKPKIQIALDKLDAGPVPYAPVYDDDGEETGNYEFSFKTNATYTDKKTQKLVKKEVTMFDAKGKKLEKRPNVWGGSTLKANFTAAPYYNAATNSAGVSLRMNAVQIIDLVSSGGGNASTYGFGEEEGYEAADNEESGPFSNEQGSGQAGGSGEDEDF